MYMDTLNLATPIYRTAFEDVQLVSSDPVAVPTQTLTPEEVRAILTDIPITTTAGTAVNDVTVPTVQTLPTLVDSIPTTIDVTNNFKFSDWIKANPIIATAGGALILYSVYLLSKKRKRR